MRKVQFSQPQQIELFLADILYVWREKVALNKLQLFEGVLDQAERLIKQFLQDSIQEVVAKIERPKPFLLDEVFLELLIQLGCF